MKSEIVLLGEIEDADEVDRIALEDVVADDVHIAFRAADDAEQAAMAKKLVAEHGMHPTDQRDRNYFRSIYFREPGHVLFEIATDIPGFAIDEPVASLGGALKLPPFLEPHRGEIEKVLPVLEAA